MAGGFFGGLAEGMDEAKSRQIQQQQTDQQGQYQQGMLRIEQQRVKNQQERELFARADKDVSNLMDTASRTIEALKLQGKDNQTIAKAVQPVIQAAKRLRQSSGGDPTAIDAQLAAALAQPSPNDLLNPPASPQSQQPSGNLTQRGPSDIPAQPSGTGPQPPGQNMTDQQATVVSQGPATVSDNSGAIPSTGNDQEISRLQNVIASPGVPDGVKQIAKIRLEEAMKRRNELPQYFKTQDPVSGEEKIVGVDKRTGRQFDVVDNSADAAVKAKIHDAFDKDLHGTEFLQAIPAKFRNEIKAIATYRQNPNTTSVKGGRREQVMGWVHQYNPEYDQNVFSSKNRSYQVVGNRIGAIETGLQAAKATAPRVLQTSAEVNRTNFPSLNAIILAGQQGTGDKAVVQYGIALNTFIMNYARAMGGGSSVLTDSARGEAAALLQKAWSQGQIGAAIDQMMKEMDSELSGAKNTMSSLREAYGDPDQPAAQPAAGGAKQGSSIPAPPAGFVMQ